MLLDGFGIAGYRSFREELAVFGPLDRVTLLAGANNSGKSNVLRVLRDHLGSSPAPLGGLDTPLGVNNRPLGLSQRLAVARRVSDDDLPSLFQRGDRGTARAVRLKRLLERAPFRLAKGADDLLWVVYSRESAETEWKLDAEWLQSIARDFMEDYHATELQSISMDVAGIGHGDALLNLQSTLGQLRLLDELPKVKVLEAFRQITDESDTSDFTPDGRGVVAAVAKLEQPAATHRSDILVYQALNQFLKDVLEDDSARLTVSRDPEELMVERGDLVLPLSSLGTGIHQVVILAVAVTLFNNTLICIEEPEVHLHPLLQRKLGRYLREQARNQYVIATHSAHLLDIAASGVYHLQLADTGTDVVRADSPRQVRELCADLGYRPSDLLQANAVIWVEGPSDRIYVRHWLSLVAPELIEHVHYSVMFYGGRLLRHLTADDVDVQDFIRLRHLNRYLAIIIDSDKRSSRARINETKQRVVAEVGDDDAHALSWVTAGREIENYIPVALLNRALLDTHPKVRDFYDGGRYSSFISDNAGVRIDKIHLARRVTELWDHGTEGRFDLTTRLGSLVQLLRRANGLTVPAAP